MAPVSPERPGIVRLDLPVRLRRRGIDGNTREQSRHLERRARWAVPRPRRGRPRASRAGAGVHVWSDRRRPRLAGPRSPSPGRPKALPSSGSVSRCGGRRCATAACSCWRSPPAVWWRSSSAKRSSSFTPFLNSRMAAGGFIVALLYAAAALHHRYRDTQADGGAARRPAWSPPPTC